MILISIIIPTFQRANVVESKLQAYLSVLNKAASTTGTSFECIVVDDYSTDGTFDRLQQLFSNTYEVVLLRTTENLGPGPARDFGLFAAKGHWIWFLDDDDAIDQEQVTALFAQLQRTPTSVDLISHTLKCKYSESSEKVRLKLAKNIIAFREYQEVFRHVIRKTLLINHNIKFSQGFHEDIRYVVEIMLRAKGVSVMQHPIVFKNKTAEAITAKMTVRRIEGYIKAYNETVSLLQKSEIGTSQVLKLFTTQSLGVLLYLITRETDKTHCLLLLEHLRNCCQNNDSWSYGISTLPVFNPHATNFEYAGHVWRSEIDNQLAILLQKILDVFNSRLSCKDLDSSLFLGPDEIRACCKRFFVNGIRKGDVVLLKADESIDLKRIQSSKQELINRINQGTAHECSGCPYIERRTIYKGGIDYMSLENFAYCNMRCTYCSPKYYGGTEAKYNAANIVSQVALLPIGFEPHCHVVWGGGEPTLSPRFEPINQRLKSTLKSGKIRVLSNSLKYSNILEEQLKDEHFHLVTSIDAGTEETFKIIRGKPGLSDVINNLVRYQSVLNDPRRLTIKYIIGSTNYSSHELQTFVEKIAGSPLLNSLFQISCDFTLDAPEDDIVCALYELSLRLLNQGARFVFFDDLVRDRVKISPVLANRVREHLSSLNIGEQHLVTPDCENSIVLWGVGLQAQWLSQHTLTGKSGGIVSQVKDINEFNKIYFDIKNKKLSIQNQIAIFPAGVQSIYEIICNIEKAGFSSFILRGVMI
jgi:hypothetical protein